MSEITKNLDLLKRNGVDYNCEVLHYEIDCLELRCITFHRFAIVLP